MKLYLTVREVAVRYGVDAATIWRWRKNAANSFPQPHDFGPQTKRWKIADLDAWDDAIKARAA
ncbi:helix-turn-helix transcriptional regulator [Loktanella salsilacus]|uniref:helix-turn-helix transcriptional regulator n=1 Tax=Loktanella salsilacus TaxID=195913 RepID=UPI0020B83806|nr:AlpA family phage regulatory protein [Loktanella salsilacus]UTH45327.1 AlpA family phage regulatory protein [Loktanella salsilacus]